VRLREAKDVQTSTGVEHKKTALLVDCDAVRVDGDGVTQFTTAGVGEQPLEGDR
jgi:hypothetical protein